MRADSLGMFALTAREFETRFKRRFDAHHVSGEWFRWVDDIADVWRVVLNIEQAVGLPRQQLGREMCRLMQWPDHWVKISPP